MLAPGDPGLGYAGHARNSRERSKRDVHVRATYVPCLLMRAPLLSTHPRMRLGGADGCNQTMNEAILTLARTNSSCGGMSV